MQMRILIDLTPIYDHLTGVERYNINISKHIISQHPEDFFILVFKECIHDEFKEIALQPNVEQIIIPACSKLLFIQWKLYRAIKKIQADYYLFLSFTSPVLLKTKGIINAIHDLTCWDCPETIPAKMKAYYRIAFRCAVKHSKKIVTVSKFSQKRICEKYGLNKQDVPVIYDGLTEVFRNPPDIKINLSEKYHIPPQYMLSLSTLEPRKNLKLLIKTYTEMLDEGDALPDLVLAGRQGWKLEEVTGTISEDTKTHIHFTGFVEDLDLPQLYREAQLFVFPSIYEGFGLPVIEAMSQGTIVICSDAASLPEVANGAGYLFKSNNLEDLKRTIRNAISDNSHRTERVRKGIETSNRYNWAQEAKKLYECLYCDYRKELSH